MPQYLVANYLPDNFDPSTGATLLPTPPIRYEEKNHEIRLFGLLRQKQI